MFSVNGYNFLCITLLLFFASIMKLHSQLRVFSTKCILKTAQTTRFKRHLPLYPQLKMLQDTEGLDWHFILKTYLLLARMFQQGHTLPQLLTVFILEEYLQMHFTSKANKGCCV